MAERVAGDTICKYTCHRCGYRGHGWYSDLWQEHKAFSPKCYADPDLGPGAAS